MYITEKYIKNCFVSDHKTVILLISEFYTTDNVAKYTDKYKIDAIGYLFLNDFILKFFNLNYKYE